MLPSFARCTRLLTATIAALAVLAGAAASADAAPTCGNKLCLETTHTPDSDFIIPNGYLNYRVDITNPGTATATKVVLTFTLDSRATLVSSPAGCTQPPATVVTCPIGSVKPTRGTPLTFTFVAQMPSTETAADAPISSTASITADARASDKGNNPNDPTTETFSDAPEEVAVDLRQGVSASAVPDGVQVTLDTDPNGTGATNTDKRTAKFRLFPIGFATTATVTDEVQDAGFVCPAKLKCPTGGWTESFIPGAKGLTDPFVFPSVMEIELVYDVSTLPSGLSRNSYVLLHDDDYNASTKNYEQISRSCDSNPAPCLEDVFFNADGDLVVTALVTGNWRYR
jgi:uncharacterized repeat protein (TIGR01451 family)